MLQTKLTKEIIPELLAKKTHTNALGLPSLLKVVINYRVSEAKDNKEALEDAQKELQAITGQKPMLCCARQAVAAFRLRQGDPLALKVTLRGKRMYNFLEKFFFLALPRVRDFRGLPLSAFDSQGNYSIGLSDQSIFPEVDLDRIKKIRGMQITLVLRTSSQKNSNMLLSALGLPFEKK